ncbi:MAG: hypothetical protein AAF391_08215 [Bacteroidota bacterium]
MGAVDIKSKVNVVQLFNKIQRTATASIQGTEVADYHGACFVVDVGTHTADDLVVTYQESDDNSTWSNIAETDLEQNGNTAQSRSIVAGDADSQVYVGYKGNKRYIGAVITDSGTGDAVVGVLVVKGSPKSAPANN